MSVLGVKDKSKHEGERKNEVGLDPAAIAFTDCYTMIRCTNRLTKFTFH